MFVHVFYYRLKCLLRDRVTIFWTLVFPLVLATLYGVTFGDIKSQPEGFQPIKVAVIQNSAYENNKVFKMVLEDLSEPGPQQFLEITVTDGAEALKLLDNGLVAGVISQNDDIELLVNSSGLKQTILKSFLDSYSQNVQTVKAVMAQNSGISPRTTSRIGRHDYTEQIFFSQANPDTRLSIFYALLAMSCFYSSFWGLRNTRDIQADLSPQGARRGVAPTHKLALVFADNLAAFVIGFSEILIILAYLRFGLGITFGNQALFILLTCILGCFTGVSFGNFIGTVIRANENLKMIILISTTMTFSFLSGLMWEYIKYYIAQKAPFLSYINPVALIADSFYSLYIFAGLHRFWLNMAILALLWLAFSLISFALLRRERYASL